MLYEGVTQTILGRGPEFGEPAGNCMQAALATVFGCALEEVPHFLADYPNDSEWWDRMNAWLMEHHGVALVGLVAGGWDVPDVVHLSQGITERGSHHVVVSRGGVMIFDPHPSRAGLVEVKHHELFVTTPNRKTR